MKVTSEVASASVVKFTVSKEILTSALVAPSTWVKYVFTVSKPLDVVTFPKSLAAPSLVKVEAVLVWSTKVADKSLS